MYVALSASTRESGAMQVVPGSHKLGSLGAITYDGDPMQAYLTGVRNSSAQNAFAFDFRLNAAGWEALGAGAEQASLIELHPGEASMHSVDLLHGGGPNTGPTDRVAFVMRFVSARTRCRTEAPDSAMLVRGQTRDGHFALEPRPQSDFSDEAYEALLRAVSGTPSGFGDRLMKPTAAQVQHEEL